MTLCGVTLCEPTPPGVPERGDPRPGTPRPCAAAPAYRARAGVALAALAVVAATLAGCSSAVQVTVPEQADSAACAAAARLWPADVSGRKPVDVSPSSPAVRAYGDPAVIARCGVAEPAPSTGCLSVNDVDWVVTMLTDGAKFVTYGRSPALEVLVPASLAPGNEGSLLPVFTAAAQALPTTGRRCS